MELSSANRNEIQVRIRTWVPTNVNETTPSGYLIKWRVDGDPVWSRGFQIEHNATAYNSQFSIKGLEPDTLYFIQIIPFVKRDGLVYYRETDYEYGPISTLSSGEFQSCVINEIQQLKAVLHQSHKSHNSPVLQPTIHHSEQNVRISVSNSAFWKMGHIHCGICKFVLNRRCTQFCCALFYCSYIPIFLTKLCGRLSIMSVLPMQS